MNLPRISSPDNPLLRQFRIVASGVRKAPADLVVCEGIRVLEEATASGHEIVAALVDDDFGTTPREAALLKKWLEARTRTVRTTRELFRTASGVQTPQGAAAIVRVPPPTIQELRLVGAPLVVCACGVQDPGNLGSIVRSAAAAGAALFCTITGTVSPRNPKAVRASAGTCFRLPQVEGLAAADFLNFCRSRSIEVYRTVPAAGRSYERCDFRKPCAFVLGSEGRGLEGREWDSTPQIRIPMAPGVESLNVAAAAAVLLMETLRQRRNNWQTADDGVTR